mgnify:CR=1 FL=1
MTPSHIACARPPPRGGLAQSAVTGGWFGSSIFIALRGCSLWRNTL